MRKFIDIVTEGLDPLQERRLGSAVALNEIPAKYKQLPVLGRGTTTIALDLDPDHVLLFTRDGMKFDWLSDEGLIEYIDEYKSFRNQIAGMNEIPIIIVKMKKLVPLSPANIKIANKLIDEFTVEWRQTTFRSHKDEVFRAIYNKFGSNEKHILYRLMNFLANYDTKQFDFDLHIGNFMQTREGELVVLDPIVCSEVLKLILNGMKARAEAKSRNQSFGNYGFGSPG